MAENKPVDVDREKATPLEATEPVEMPAALGATFAERAAANKQADSKAVAGDAAENKAVSSSATKSRRTKK